MNSGQPGFSSAAGKIQIQIKYAQEKIVQKQNNQIREAYLISEVKD